MKDLTFEKAYLNIIKEEGQQLIVADDKDDVEEAAITEDPENQENPEDTEGNDNTENHEDDSDDQTDEPDDNIEDPENTAEPEDNSDDVENPEDNMDSAETNQEFEDDGWGEQMQEDLSPVLNKLDDFSYEIKNCVRGSMTGAKTKDELADYIDSLVEELNSFAENLRG